MHDKEIDEANAAAEAAAEAWADEHDEFVRIYQLLRLSPRHYIPRIAHHLLTGGVVWGADRYGINRRFAKDTDPKEIQALLDLLAEQLAHEQSFKNATGDEPPPSDRHVWDGGLYQFDWGWDTSKPDSGMPDFDNMNPHEVEIKAAPNTIRNSSTIGRGDKNNLALIGVMLALLTGRTTIKRGTFTSDAQLIAALDSEEFNHVEGLSKGTLNDKFAQAKEYGWRQEWRDKSTK